MSGLTGDEKKFSSAKFISEIEAAIQNAKSRDDLANALNITTDALDAVSEANSPSVDNPFATMDDVPVINVALLPTSDQKNALAGTSGTPSASNAYVTTADARLVGAVTTSVYLDSNRTDTYTADGSVGRPFKTVADSVAYFIAQGKAGVAWYATGTYTTTGGTVTLPDLALVVHGNRSMITGSSTYNIPGPYIAKNLDVDGNVNFTSGSVPSAVKLEGQTIDGSVTIAGDRTVYLSNVTITGNLSLSSGTAPVYMSFDSAVLGNTTGATARLQQVVSIEVDSVNPSRVLITNVDGSITTSDVTSAELAYLTGVTAPIQEQIDAEIAERELADSKLASISPICYYGGNSTFLESSARAGWIDYGGTAAIKICPFSAGTIADMTPVVLSFTDLDSDTVRLQISITLDTGTLVLQTTTRLVSLYRYSAIAVPLPLGTIAAASVTAYVNNVALTIANGGLEVVGTSYTGLATNGTGAWALGSMSDGSNPLTCCYADKSWRALNYELSADDYALWFATGKLPHAGAGTMQALPATTASCDSTTNMAGFSGATLTVQSTIARAGNAIEVTSAAVTYTGFFLYQQFRAETTYRVSAWIYVPSGQAVTPALSSVNTFSVGGAVHGALSGTIVTDSWCRIERDITTTVAQSGMSLYLSVSNTAGILMYVDDIRITALGDFCAGLALATQPVCARTDGGEVLLHSASGVSGFDLPERMTPATQTEMIADGYLLGDQLTHPANYVADKVLVTNKGSASATVTLRAKSSGGTSIATGTVSATGLPVSLPIGSLSALTAAGGKVYVTGGAATSPIKVVAILVRS